MSRISFQGLVIASAMGFAWPVTALAQMTPATPPAQTTQTPPAATSSAYTDAQVRSFATARTQIDPIRNTLPTLSTSDRAQANARISGILRTNNLTMDQYNSIASAARADTALNARINGAGGSAAAGAATMPPTTTP
jgi:hypothetical protein